MLDFRRKILDVIRDNEQLVMPFLATQAGRTHAFLGAWHRTIQQSVFSRHGESNCTPCILTQVYQRTYPASSPKPVASTELLPFFELYRMDCHFLAPRTSDRKGFPVLWDYDWIIEVENNPAKFAHELRILLDLTCQHRLGIFFIDAPDLSQRAQEFLPSWDDFVAHHPCAAGADLQVVFFPTSYSDWSQYDASSSSCVWQPGTRSFCRI